MPSNAANSVSHFIEAFETAVAVDPSADLAAFAPPAGSPLRAVALAELIRVDLERRWRSGHPGRLADYRARYPEAFAALHLPGLAFEEYRQRRLAGEEVEPHEYALAFAVDVSAWEAIPPGSLAVQYGLRDPSATRRNAPLPPRPDDTPPPRAATPDHLRETLARPRNSDPNAADRGHASQRLLPIAGGTFLGFFLEQELGRGAFGRVFLARQSDLSGRPVALKVACDAVNESQHLARLQHTNIVPIYSFHRAGPLHAVCMPYFGRVTLADVLGTVRRSNSVPRSGKELKSIVVESSRTGATDVVGTHWGDAPPPVTDAWLRVDGCDYPRAVVWLGMQMADGLAHAHARGILHRDLKPANVLLADDGRPMLLDFNLAEDVTGHVAADKAAVGGTLPYMSPEQLRAFAGASEPLDGRTDVFSLGVILFELLTGQRPYIAADVCGTEDLAALVAERCGPPPSPRARNPLVPWAVDAVVRKCLAPDPADRYPSALALRDDLDREMTDRPLATARNPSRREQLRKWTRRNSVVTSAAAVATVAAVLLAVVAGAWWVSRERARTFEARETLAAHASAFREAQAFADDRTLTAARPADADALLANVLARYGVTADTTPEEWEKRDDVVRLPDGDRRRVRDDLGEAWFLRANLALRSGTANATAAKWSAAAGRFGDRIPHAVLSQRMQCAELAGNTSDAAQTAELLARTPADSPRDQYLSAYRLWSVGRARDALAGLQAATQSDPGNFSAWFVRGQVHLALDQPDLAAVAFAACIAVRPEFAPAWLNRGLSHASAHRYDDARSDYDQAIARRPDWAEAYLQRATVRSLTGDFSGANDDLTAALGCGDATPRLFFLRASVRQQLGDTDSAAADRVAGLARMPTDELSWVARAEHRAAIDPNAALADVNEALKLNPLSTNGLQMKAHLLAERLARPTDARAVLDFAIRNYPDSAGYRVGRGVLLARAGERDAALVDARAALDRDSRPPALYAAGCVFALTATSADDRREAMRLVWLALKGGFGAEYLDNDPDLNALRPEAEFSRLAATARALRAAPEKSRKSNGG